MNWKLSFYDVGGVLRFVIIQADGAGLVPLLKTLPIECHWILEPLANSEKGKANGK